MSSPSFADSLLQRPAAARDVPLIFSIVNDAYSIEAGNTGVAFKRGNRYKTADEINPAEYLVLETPGPEPEVIACARVVLLEADTPCWLAGVPAPIEPKFDALSKKHSRCGVPFAMFGPFAVAKAHQGKGIASVLLRAVEQRAAALGARGIEIVVVNWRTDVQPFYTKRGFKYVYTATWGERPFLTRPSALYIMRKTLAE